MRVAAYTGNYELVPPRVVIGKTARKLRRSRRIEFPAEPQIERQFLRRLPLIAGIGEKPPIPVRGKVSIDVASGLAGHIEQKTGKVISYAGLGSGNRRLICAECVDPAWAERLILQ